MSIGFFFGGGEQLLNENCLSATSSNLGWLSQDLHGSARLVASSEGSGEVLFDNKALRM